VHEVARPSPVPADGAADPGRHTAAHRFSVIDVHGNQMICEYLGPRRHSPAPGTVVEIAGRRRNGVVEARRITSITDRSASRPRADLLFTLTRLAAGAAGTVGLALLAGSLVAMTLRGL
jgi:hypothetical protein